MNYESGKLEVEGKEMEATGGNEMKVERRQGS